MPQIQDASNTLLHDIRDTGADIEKQHNIRWHCSGHLWIGMQLCVVAAVLPEQTRTDTITAAFNGTAHLPVEFAGVYKNCSESINRLSDRLQVTACSQITCLTWRMEIAH